MSTLTNKPESARKVLAIRATEEERRVLMLAAKGERRSLSSFVLQSALEAAQVRTGRVRTQESVDAALTHAQELMRPYRERGLSLLEELYAERREEASRG
jgi:uncharacterized protein (DUF1778 family)